MGCLFYLPVTRLSAREFFLVSYWTGCAWWTPAAIAELTDIKFELGDGAAQSVAMHSQLSRGAALVAFVFLKNSCYKTLLELSDCFGIENVALVHLVDKCFQLIFHGISLSVLFKRPDYKSFTCLDAACGLPRRK